MQSNARRCNCCSVEKHHANITSSGQRPSACCCSSHGMTATASPDNTTMVSDDKQQQEVQHRLHICYQHVGKSNQAVADSRSPGGRIMASPLSPLPTSFSSSLLPLPRPPLVLPKMASMRSWMFCPISPKPAKPDREKRSLGWTLALQDSTSCGGANRHQTGRET